MIKYLLLFLLPLSLYASKILSYNIYERTDRADVMITFDTPFSGVIKQSKGKNRIIIKLEGASIETSKIKKVNSDFLHSLTITPMKNQTQILATISSGVRLIASKTSDSYGLRLRFSKKGASKSTSNSPVASTTDLSALPTKKDGEFSNSYYIVVGILIVGIIILLVLKKKMVQPNQNRAQDSWLFKSNTQATQPPAKPEAVVSEEVNGTNVSIRFQKAINSTNSVVMLDFGDESYLVLMGNSNILLDKFRDDKPTTQLEFETILQDRNRELEDFLGDSKQQNTSASTPTHKEPLQAYKERAASLIYSDEY